MFARWPSLFIQAAITAAASAWPRAMFSPPRPDTLALAARSHGDFPSGSVWSKKPRAAMSSLKFWASEASEELAVTGLQPTLARSWLTRESTAASAEVPGAGAVDWRAAGAEGEALVAAGLDVLAGAEELFVAPAAGAFEEADGFVRSSAAVFVGSDVFDGDADGEAEAEGEPASGEPDFVGPLARSAERLAWADADARSAGAVVEPPCVSRSGALSERTWSAAVPPATS